MWRQSRSCLGSGSLRSPSKSQRFISDFEGYLCDIGSIDVFGRYLRFALASLCAPLLVLRLTLGLASLALARYGQASRRQCSHSRLLRFRGLGTSDAFAPLVPNPLKLCVCSSSRFLWSPLPPL